MNRVALAFLVFLLSSVGGARQTGIAAQDYPRGQIIDNVVCAADATQSYALYLPTTFTPARTWSLIIAFHPGARGRAMVEKFQAGAEQYGYLVAGSNTSRNGSMQASIASVQAMSADLGTRFPIDPARLYTAGMSGGARVAMEVALASGKVAGVIASSASYPDAEPRKSVPFAVFGTAGTEDFNNLEMHRMDEALTTPHRLAIFDGGHSLPPNDISLQAIEWLELQAMKSNRRTRDASLIDRLFAIRQKAASELKDPKDQALAWSAIATDFGGLHDVTEASAKADALMKQKDVKTALKRDKEDVETEEHLFADIFELESGLRNGDTHADSIARLTSLLAGLSRDAKKPADSIERRRARRMLRGLASGGFERTHDADYQKLLEKYRFTGAV